MAKNRITKSNQTIIATIKKVYDFKQYDKDPTTKGSVQTLQIELESGNKTLLKIWDREKYNFKSDHMIKVTVANTVEEKYKEYTNYNIHTTSKSDIVYPYAPKKTSDNVLPPNIDNTLKEIVNRIDTLQNILAEHEKEIKELRENNIKLTTSISVLETKLEKKTSKKTTKKVSKS